jgi:hypothetical protein
MTYMESITITCPGCGQVLGTGAEENRAEVECLWCGTKTPVPTRQASAPSPRPEPPPQPARSRPPEQSAVKRAGRALPARTAEESPAQDRRWSEQTPYSLGEAPAGSPSPAPPSPDRPPADAISRGPSRPAVTPPSPLAEDGAAYGLKGPPERPCPGCARALPADAVLCPSCGFNQETRERTRRTYEPVRRTWEMGWPLRRRVLLFALGQAVAVPLGLLGAWVFRTSGAFFGPWLVFTALSAFLLGTYSRTDLSRAERGRVQLKHTWRICFFPRPTQSLRLSQYDGVTSGKAPAADFWEWFVLIVLLVMGVVLGALWWYYMIRRDSFFVALTRDHGHPDLTLYWGWDEGRAQEMARTIGAVAFATT